MILLSVAFGNLCHLFLGPSCELCFPYASASYLQIGMVSSILAYSYGSSFAWITSVSVATYIAFTLAVTQV
jgi:ABC-type transport system involved in Fe-S cluster assembly fused permease/ATPase subunit